MDKVIIYGLGNEYNTNQITLERVYDIVGYSDSDKGKIESLDNDKRGKVVSIEELKNGVIDYDYILITTVVYADEIKSFLKDLGILPERIRIFAYEKNYSEIWGVQPLKGVSYSGGAEDIIIDNIMHILGIPYAEMKYIELGVLNPVCGNNTYYFYRRGATGILVEANLEAIENIARIRTRDNVINKAIYADKSQELTLYISKQPGLSSLLREHIENNTDWKNYPIVKEVRVKTIHIDDVFALLGEGDACDLLSIDIEGYDLQALSTLNFDVYRPKVIVAELTSGYLEKKKYYEEIVKLLLKKNYVLYCNNECNGIFVDEKYKNMLI